MKYTKIDVINEVDSWIQDIRGSYENSEISTNCLVHEWEQLRKKLSKK